MVGFRLNRSPLLLYELGVVYRLVMLFFLGEFVNLFGLFGMKGINGFLIEGNSSLVYSGKGLVLFRSSLSN